MKFDFSDVRTTTYGGVEDAIALAFIMAGGFFMLPLLLGGRQYAFGIVACWCGAWATWFGLRAGSKIRITHGSAFALNSHEPLPITEGAVRIGYVAHTMQELAIPASAWLRHAMIVGQSGVGKTVLGSWLMLQQIAAGGGLLWIDGKLDPDNIEMLHQMCTWAGRGGDLLIVNPGTPSASNTYNPLLDGDADEVASRLGALLPEAAKNAGADFYRASAINAISELVAATRVGGYSLTFADLRVLLTRPSALEWLKTDLERGDHGAEAEQFSLFLDQLRTKDFKSGTMELSSDGLRKLFGGLGARLAQFGGGNFGAVMNSYNPEVRLKSVVRQGKILYLALPTMGKGEAATALGRMALGDFRSAIASIQALPVGERPQRPFLGFFDEAGSYVTQAWSRMFEQARSARLVMLPAFQTRANLETLGPELRAMVAGNTLTKVFFKPGEPDTAEWMADMIGKEAREVHTHSESAGQSARGVTILDRGRGATNSTSGSRNSSHSTTIREDYKVSAAELMRLGQGECVVTVEGHRTYHVRVPRVTFDPDFVQSVGPFRVRHPAPRGTGDLEPLRILTRPGVAAG